MRWRPTKARIGVVVDDARAAQLREANEVTAAYDRALNLLAFRARSARELAAASHAEGRDGRVRRER